MVWRRTFGERKYRVTPVKSFDKTETFYRSSIESPRFNYPKTARFRSKANAIEYTERELENYMSWQKRKYDEKQELKKNKPNVKVGDIFINSWGYDQTNVNYYQVTKRLKSSVKIRGIGKKSVGDSDVMPVKGSFTGKEEMRRILPRGGIKTEYGWASKYKKGSKNYVTPWGMGH